VQSVKSDQVMLTFKTISLDSTFAAKTKVAFISTTPYDHPLESGPFDPFIPSWYIYLPFSDTLKIEAKCSNEPNIDICTEPNNLFLGKGWYKLLIDSIFAKKSYAYRISVHFCDSTFSRRFMLLR
jgi:hypothetical protein